MNSGDDRASVFGRMRSRGDAALFPSGTQPSTKRGALLLALLVLVNIAVGIAVLILGARYPILSGLAVLAWSFGFRHAMDADHIAAIDNVTRRLLYRGKPSVGVGPYFSLGHSTVVLLLTLVLVFVIPHGGNIDAWKSVGTIIGAVVSSAFLLLIGAVNIGVLVKLIAAWKDLRAGRENMYHGHMHLGGPIEKLFRPLLRLVDRSSKMFGIGFLFGLGFDTATEVGLLALSALAVASVPPLAVLILPLAFMAGMALLDAVNGLCMLGIYTWGVFDVKRRLAYNITVTLLSLVSALVIGLILGLRALAEYGGFSGGIFALAELVPLEYAGYILAGLFVAVWVAAIIGLRRTPKES